MKYWHNKGKFSDLFEQIWQKYVPNSGECENKEAELVRCFGRINYDMGNNGACNMFSESSAWDEWGNEEEDFEYEDLTDFYQDMFDKLGAVISYKSLVNLERECRSLANRAIDFDEIEWIDKVGDELGEYIKGKNLVD